MSPKPHVARQAVLVFLALIVLAVVGFPTTAMIIAAGVLVIALG